MKRSHLIDHFGSGDMYIRYDGTFKFANGACEYFGRNFLPGKHFFSILEFSNQIWNILSPFCIKGLFFNLDVGTLMVHCTLKRTTTENDMHVVVSSDMANAGVEKQEKDAACLQESKNTLER